jgi:hypothetical protein
MLLHGEVEFDFLGEFGIESAVPKDTPRAAAEHSRPHP